MGEGTNQGACVRCGDPIGAYEMFWVALPDGTVRSSSVRTLGCYLRRGSQRWHAQCLPPERRVHARREPRDHRPELRVAVSPLHGADETC